MMDSNGGRPSFGFPVYATFLHPFSCMVSGPSACGKSVFVKKLLRFADVMIVPPPQIVRWYYSVWQDWYLDFDERVEFVEGLPDVKKLDSSTRNLLVLDDAMHEVDEGIEQLFTKYSHHKNTSVIFICQNVFHRGKHQRTMSLNSNYMVLFRNPRDATQISVLGSQMFPGRQKFLRSAFEDATSRPYGYLLLDLKAATPDALRVRTNVFPGEQPVVVYA